MKKIDIKIEKKNIFLKTILLKKKIQNNKNGRIKKISFKNLLRLTKKFKKIPIKPIKTKPNNPSVKIFKSELFLLINK